MIRVFTANLIIYVEFFASVDEEDERIGAVSLAAGDYAIGSLAALSAHLPCLSHLLNRECKDVEMLHQISLALYFLMYSSWMAILSSRPTRMSSFARGRVLTHSMKKCHSAFRWSLLQ